VKEREQLTERSGSASFSGEKSKVEKRSSIRKTAPRALSYLYEQARTHKVRTGGGEKVGEIRERAEKNAAKGLRDPPLTMPLPAKTGRQQGLPQKRGNPTLKKTRGERGFSRKDQRLNGRGAKPQWRQTFRQGKKTHRRKTQQMRPKASFRDS